MFRGLRSFTFAPLLLLLPSVSLRGDGGWGSERGGRKVRWSNWGLHYLPPLSAMPCWLCTVIGGDTFPKRLKVPMNYPPQPLYVSLPPPHTSFSLLPLSARVSLTPLFPLRSFVTRTCLGSTISDMGRAAEEWNTRVAVLMFTCSPCHMLFLSLWLCPGACLYFWSPVFSARPPHYEKKIKKTLAGIWYYLVSGIFDAMIKKICSTLSGSK